MASAEFEKRKREEYEMQLFGFHSRAVYATLKSIVQEKIQSKSKKLFETLEKIYKPDSENLKVLKSNEKQLIRAYYKGSMPSLENIENIVNKCIAVPSNVLSNEDKCQRVQYTETEYEDMKHKLECLQQRTRRAIILNGMLKEELDIMEQFIPFENNVDRVCNIIEQGLKCSDTNGLIEQVVEDYKMLEVELKKSQPVSEKMIYNQLEGVRFKEIDLDDL